MQKSFWHGKRVFVTGHTGFKGSWLCLLLNRLGATVYGYALAPSTDPNLFTLARVGELVSSTQGDVRDIGHLREALHQSAPEIVIHLAAQPIVRASYLDPASTYATNVMGTVNVLEGVRQIDSVRVVVNVTSDKCYRNDASGTRFTEHDSLGGDDPYSSSKACSELVTEAFRRSYFGSPGSRVALATARAGNVIGGGDWAPDRLIPDAIRSLVSRDTVEIRNPAAVRPWQFVLEPLEGYLLLAERLWQQGPEFAESWNFGPDDEDAMPVHAVISRLTELWGHGASWRFNGGDHPHEANCLRLNCDKARARLGWRPRTNLDDALRWTVEWYKHWAAGADVLELCDEQIERFRHQEPAALCERPSAGFAKAG